jgi:hypothetical protein
MIGILESKSSAKTFSPPTFCLGSPGATRPTARLLKRRNVPGCLPAVPPDGRRLIDVRIVFQCPYGFDYTTEELAMPVYLTVQPQNPEAGPFAAERRNLNILGKVEPKFMIRGAAERRGIIDFQLVILCDANHEIVPEDFNLLHVFAKEDAFPHFRSSGRVRGREPAGPAFFVGGCLPTANSPQRADAVSLFIISAQSAGF